MTMKTDLISRFRLIGSFLFCLLAFVLASLTGCGGSGGGPGQVGDPPSLTPDMASARMAEFGREGGSTTAQLTPGWNFVALPYEPGTGSTATGGKIEVFRLQPTVGSYAKQGGLTTASDLLKLEPGIGYWVNAEKAVKITLLGGTTSVGIQLSPGWNSFGVFGSEPAALSAVKVLDGGAYVPLLDSATVRKPIYSYDSSKRAYAPLSAAADTLKPGQAYWVYANSAALLVTHQNGIEKPLISSLTNALVGPTTTATFSIGLEASVGTPTEAIIEHLQAGSWVTVGTLYDNGNEAQGDDIPGDRQYFSRVQTSSSSAQDLLYRAKITYSKDGGSVATLSNVVSIRFYSEVTEARAQEAIKTVNDMKAQLDATAASQGISAAVTKVLNTLKADPNVVKTGVAGSGRGVWWMTKEGIPCAVTSFSPGVKGGGQVRPGGKPVQGTPLPWQAAPRNSGRSPEDQHQIGNRKAIFIAAYQDQFTPNDEGVTLPTAFQNSEDGDFEVSTFVNGQATVSAFKQMAGKGVVVVSSHGDSFYDGIIFNGWGSNDPSAKVAVLTRESANPLSLIGNMGDLLSGRLVLANGTYAITAGFVEKYCVGMPNSLVYVSSCRSTFNGTLANAFLGAGAGTFFGYSDYVGTTFAFTHGTALFAKLLEGKTVQDSFTPGLVETDADPARFDFYGDDQLKIILTGLINGSFEDGLNAWNKQGDARVIPQLGPLTVQHKTSMAIISTGLGAVSDSNSLLSQTFKVPSDATTLKLYYNVVSEEPSEFVGTQFDDEAQITIGGASPTIIARETVNSSIWSAISGINFPGGDDTTYHTGWKTVNYDISSYRGQKVTLQLQCFDRGDSIYDTAIIIDGIEVLTAPK